MTAPLKMTAKCKQRGFTMLELSIVLVIIALVTAMAATSAISVLSTTKLNATISKMAAIDKALMSFRVANDRLPCPADLTITPSDTTQPTGYSITRGTDYGWEAGSDGGSAINIATGVCMGTGMTPQANFYASMTNSDKSYEGAIPTYTLGLPSDFMYDGWGNRFRYVVDGQMTAVGSFPAMPLNAVCGAITINDVNGNTRSGGSVYALVSHGPNGHGAYTLQGVTLDAGSTNANELINCHCTSAGATNTGTGGVQSTNPATYVQASPSVDSTNSTDNFDDIVTYKERWQMQTPWDTQAGNAIWVADTGNNRVQEFLPSGLYFGQLGCATGACTASAANGLFNNPSYVTVDPSGNIWVSDTNNARVQEFNSCGVYQTSLGGGYNGVTGTKNTKGYNNGQFEQPNGIAFDAAGNVWVADSPWIAGTNTAGGRIQEFNATTGAWMESIGGGGICATGTSCVLHAHSTTATITTGSLSLAPVNCYTNFACSPGNAGINTYAAEVPLTFGAPSDMIFDSSNNLWVLDAWDIYYPIKELSTTGNLIQTLGNGGYFDGTNFYGYNFGQFTYFGSTTYGVGGGLAFDLNGNLWIADAGNNRIQQVNPITGSWMGMIGGGNTTSATLPAASGLCFVGSCILNYTGSATILTTPSDGPVACKTNGTPTAAACTASASYYAFNTPIGLRIDSKGNIWVVDSVNNRLEEFNSSGIFVQTVGAAGTANGQFNNPLGMAIGGR